MRRPHTDRELEQLRDQILAADRALLEAFARRLEIARLIRTHKLGLGYEMLDPERERELFRHWRENTPPGISDEGLRSLFETVLRLSKQEAWREED